VVAVQAAIFKGTIQDLLEQEQEQPKEFADSLFFGCSPEVSDLLHHLLFDAKGG